MIKFALICESGHEFESWFQNGSAYEAQIKANLLECPFCRNVHVSKAIMAPAVASHRDGTETFPMRQGLELTAVEKNASPEPLLDEQSLHFRQVVRSFHQKLKAEAVDVGSNFPNEVRKIHEGKAPDRLIVGRASLEEAKGLLEEGIGIFPVPPIPEDLN
jgi:hypothetical protein